MREIDPLTEFKCIYCEFPNPIEYPYCMMCRRNKQGKFHDIDGYEETYIKGFDK